MVTDPLIFDVVAHAGDRMTNSREELMTFVGEDNRAGRRVAAEGLIAAPLAGEAGNSPARIFEKGDGCYGRSRV
jgi:hypothetical protein